MSSANAIVLRPRFKIELKRNNEDALRIFEDIKKTQSDFIINRIDDHVFIKFPKEKQHFWSPQLHLEINKVNSKTSILHGLFGPNPTVWTMFMFIHFIVAGLFIAFGIWAYTNWSLETDYTMQLFVVILMIVFWIVLYFVGRIGKATGNEQMHILYDFMNKALKL
jgi:hypothetical protein